MLLNLRGFIGTDNSVLLSEKTTIHFEHPVSTGTGTTTGQTHESIELQNSRGIVTSDAFGVEEITSHDGDYDAC